MKTPIRDLTFEEKERRTYATGGEEQALKLVEVAAGDGQETSVVVEGGASGGLVLVESVGGDEDEGGASVNNTGGGGQDASRTVLDRLVDAPVGAGRGGGGDGDVGDGTGVLAAVDATPGDLTVQVIAGLRGLEGDANGVGGDGTLGEEVIGDGRDGLAGGGQSSLSEVDGANAENAINTLEAGGL